MAEVIVGNPPFLGDKKLRSELGQGYVDSLRKLYHERVSGQADLVCYWFEKARSMIELGMVTRAGLLATQSIRMGGSRKVLERIKESGDIFWAQSDREWILDGAAVRVSMVGFDGGIETQRTLNNIKVSTINSDLSTSTDLTSAKRLDENGGICFQGPVKVGPFELEEDEARMMLSAPINVNGRSNSDIVRPWINGNDITGHPRKMWIIDFGDMPKEEAAMYEIPFEYVRRVVKPFRDKNNRERRKNIWWQHGESVPGLRRAIKDCSRIILTPRVAKHRLFVWASIDTLPDSRIYAMCRDDDYFLGVLHSRLHEVWSLATSSRHGVGNDPTYNNTTCFETFPFPWPPGYEPKGDLRVEAIAAAAKALVEKRDNWLNAEGLPEAECKKRTLTNLYNARPTWLDLAHKKLDEAVFAAYGWSADFRDEQILERLLELNLKRVSQQA